MTDNAKIITAGCTAGAVFAAVPTIYAAVRSFLPKPITASDTLRAVNGEFVTESGRTLVLHGINLNDDILFCRRSDDEGCDTVDDAYGYFRSRFGAYGAEKLIDEYENASVSESDLKHIAKLGANCVRIPVRSFLLYRKPDCKGKPKLERIDAIVEKCRKLGLYVILDLHSAPSELFDGGKDGFEARNAIIRLWSQVAVRYKDEPAVAAYDLLNRPLTGVADPEGKLDLLGKFYFRILKAIRNIDKDKIVITEFPEYIDFLPFAEKFKGKNTAFGLYSHCHTTFETDAMLKNVSAMHSNEIPFIVCKVRSDETWNYSLGKFCESGISWLIGDFKGKTQSSLYSRKNEPVIFENENYESLTEKFKNTPSTKNSTENKELSKALRLYFTKGSTERTDKHKPVVKVKIGMNVIRGVKK